MNKTLIDRGKSGGEGNVNRLYSLNSLTLPLPRLHTILFLNNLCLYLLFDLNMPTVTVYDAMALTTTVAYIVI